MIPQKCWVPHKIIKYLKSLLIAWYFGQGIKTCFIVNSSSHSSHSGGGSLLNEHMAAIRYRLFTSEYTYQGRILLLFLEVCLVYDLATTKSETKTGTYIMANVFVFDFVVT